MQYLIFILIVTFMILLVPLKGSAMGDNPKKIEQIKQDYAKLNLTDGVSKEEALIIAQNFVINDSYASSSVVISSGKVMESGFKKTLGNCWAVSFNAQLKVKRQTGLKWFTLHIDKATGEIKVKDWGPS